MLKEFIEHIQETAQPVFRECNGSTFVVTSGGAVQELKADVGFPDPLGLHSLDALVKMVQTEAIQFNEGVSHNTPIYITIPNHLTVKCFAQPNMELRGYRHLFYTAVATDVPGWGETVFMGFEETQVALRTRFQDTEGAQYLQRLLSDITSGSHVTLNDNGVATQVVTKKGVSLQTSEPIRPIVILKPYRTFQEVEQPESTFLIRVNERNISFTEADGGMWKLRARETIKAFLEERLHELVDAGKVVIAL